MKIIGVIRSWNLEPTKFQNEANLHKVFFKEEMVSAEEDWIRSNPIPFVQNLSLQRKREHFCAVLLADKEYGFEQCARRVDITTSIHQTHYEEKQEDLRRTDHLASKKNQKRKKLKTTMTKG